jgi:tRNA-splicing ligase RtcB
MKIIHNIPVFGSEVDAGALAQIKTCARTATKTVLMADHHKGYAVPIGGVVAYTNAISSSGVGFDIACGKAIRRAELELIEALSPRNNQPCEFAKPSI